MSKSILVTKTPNSCSECPVKATFIPNFWEGCEYQFNPLSLSLVEARKQRHPQCPLQDTTELSNAVKQAIKTLKYNSYDTTSYQPSETIIDDKAITLQGSNVKFEEVVTTHYKYDKEIDGLNKVLETLGGQDERN